MRARPPMPRPMAFRNPPPMPPPAPALYVERPPLHRSRRPTPLRTPRVRTPQERQLPQRSPTRNDPSTRLRTRKRRLAQAPKSEHFMGPLPPGSRRRSTPARLDIRRANIVRYRAMRHTHRQAQYSGTRPAEPTGWQRGRSGAGPQPRVRWVASPSSSLVPYVPNPGEHVGGGPGRQREPVGQWPARLGHRLHGNGPLSLASHCT